MLKKNLSIILIILLTLLLIAIVIWIFNNRIISIENKIPYAHKCFWSAIDFLNSLKNFFMKTNMRLIFAAIHFATHNIRADKNSLAAKNKQLFSKCLYFFLL